MYTKVIRFESLALWREYNRQIGKRVVATNGCFDILHRGHITYLQKARALGDILIVGINSDRSVQELKGEGRPINVQEDRAAVVAALESVDQVVIFDELRADKFLAAVQPDVWVKGGDYTIESLDQTEVATVKEGGGDVAILPIVAGRSTTRCLRLIEEAGAETAEVLEGDFSRRDEAPAADHGGGDNEGGGEEAGSILRARSSLHERGVPKG
jgi:rfaE bifunctional protein nucleotidyltransferase chain/domain